MKSFSITDIPDFSTKERMVIVGVIGKSPYRYPNKTTPLLSSVDCKENGIQCYWDERNSVLYLHATTYLDTQQLTKLAAGLDENSKTTEKDADAASWLVASGELATEACRAMALIFHLSHIVVLSSPTTVFDLGYLQLFKAIDAYRMELSTSTSEALNETGAGGTWETHGRCCCPRLLFHFRRAPRPLKKAPAALKRLEHAVEDQLYFILRKARIITNVCAKSLFAIPKNEEFVYISADEDSHRARDVSSLVRGLVGLCTGALDPVGPTTSGRSSFSHLLDRHIEQAFGDGFDDNVGKYAMSTSFFELPSAKSWRQAAAALVPLYLAEDADRDGKGALYDALATDVRFSQARCAKVLPIAQASYLEGLPPHYSSQHHAHKLGAALSELSAVARGPLGGAARRRLKAGCDAAWRARRLCAALSLTGAECALPAHDSSVEHSSGVRYISACNCGRTKVSREDPYTVKQANYTFYVLAAEECGVCNTLSSVEFPVFQPSTPTFRAASVKGGSQEGPEREEAGEASEAPEGAWSGSPEPLSPGSAEADAEVEAEVDAEVEVEEADPDVDTSPRLSPSYDVVALPEDTAQEKSISRQASTTEYLPGMLHTLSPGALLPAVSSWSLVALGPASLYSHSAGLPEHLQPGFLPHTNYLTPWECVVGRSTATPGGWGKARGRGRGSTPHPITVKIFIGFEYECPRGHRFMMSSPTTVVSGAAAGGGARLAASDMPLQAPCPCRGHVRAALARLHAVTAKPPLRLTVSPKVCPVPGGPVFCPRPAGEGPVPLAPASYWVLRLPFVYCDERGPLPRHPAAKILAPVFGLAD